MLKWTLTGTVICFCSLRPIINMSCFTRCWNGPLLVLLFASAVKIFVCKITSSKSKVSLLVRNTKKNQQTSKAYYKYSTHYHHPAVFSMSAVTIPGCSTMICAIVIQVQQFWFLIVLICVKQLFHVPTYDLVSVHTEISELAELYISK